MAKGKSMSKATYENKMMWLIDTAETPKQQKNLKKQLAELKKKYEAGKLTQPTPKKRESKKASGTYENGVVRLKVDTTKGPKKRGETKSIKEVANKAKKKNLSPGYNYKSV